jgi:hypothetical protein
MPEAEQQNTQLGPDTESLRTSHQLRLVGPSEEGTGADALPGGVYGFTYSPGLPNAPLFAERRYRSFETHKLVSGEVNVIGFATAEDAARLATSVEDVTLRVQAQPGDGCDTLVTLPYSRIRRHRQYAAPNQDGFTVTLAPAFSAAH